MQESPAPVKPAIDIEQIVRRIETRDYTIGIVGLGYVGLPLTLTAVESGFHVIGFDIDSAKVEQINAGCSPYRHIRDASLSMARAAGRFEATTQFARSAEVDAILICVPTPLGPHQEPDLSFVRNTAHSIATSLRPGHLLVLESTTYPGTTQRFSSPSSRARGTPPNKTCSLPTRQSEKIPETTSSKRRLSQG